MRIRVSSRIIVLGCLVALLCLLPCTTPVGHARPIGPDPWGDNPTPPPKGDTDGVVLAKSFVRGTTVTAVTDRSTTITVQSKNDLWSSLRTVYHHGGLRAVLSVLHVGNLWLGLR